MKFKICSRCNGRLPDNPAYFEATVKKFVDVCKQCRSARRYSRGENCFNSARGRCNNPGHHKYHLYGARGIKFKFKTCEELLEATGPRPPGTSLDRIDTNGHYEKGNVRWATPKEQNENTRIFKGTEGFLDRLISLKASGLSQANMGLILGVCKSTAGNYIRKLKEKHGK